VRHGPRRADDDDTAGGTDLTLPSTPTPDSPVGLLGQHASAAQPHGPRNTTHRSDLIQFTEYHPGAFRRVRLASGMSDELYQELFLETVKERVTQGGASGALFFFSKGEICIAKSVSRGDMQALRDDALKYRDYIEANPSSYIARIFGAYTLTIQVRCGCPRSPVSRRFR